MLCECRPNGNEFKSELFTCKVPLENMRTVFGLRIFPLVSRKRFAFVNLMGTWNENQVTRQAVNRPVSGCVFNVWGTDLMAAVFK